MVASSRRREVTRQVRGCRLEKFLGFRQTLQHVEAETPEEAGVLRPLNRIPCFAREHDLATVGCGTDSSGCVDSEPHVPRLSQSWTSRVKADPDPHACVLLPSPGENIALD